MIPAPYLTGEITAPTTATAWSIALGNLIAPGETAPAPAALTVVLWNGSDQKITSASVVLSDSHAAGASTSAAAQITYVLPSVAVPAVASGSPGLQKFAPIGLTSGLLPTLTVTGGLAADASSGSIRVGVYLHTAGAPSVGQDVTIAGSNIEVPVDLQGVDQPAADSTTTALAASGTYTGTAFDTTNARGIVGSILSDQSGTLEVQQSPDGTNWDVVDTLFYPGGSAGLQFAVPVETPGASQGRLVYTDGATAQTTFRLYAWTTPQPVERLVSVPTQVAGTTSITTAATSQTLFAARPGRRFLLVQNPSTATGQGITTAESLWIGFGTAATTAPPSMELVTGALVIFDVAVDPQEITVIAATAGHAFTARQG